MGTVPGRIAVNQVTTASSNLLRAFRLKFRNLLELQKDAERYRYMRSNSTFQDRNGPGIYWYLPRYDRELPVGERLDKAIDDQRN